MADPTPAKRQKRRLRQSSETVRERADKAQASTAKSPKRRPLRAVGRGIRKVLRVLAKPFHRQPFRFIGKILVPKYFRTSWQELRQVEWPNRRQSRQLTFAVLVFAIMFGGAVALVDYGLDKLFKAILLK